jgi:capsular exopolysaccharide synthesis family protein
MKAEQLTPMSGSITNQDEGGLELGQIAAALRRRVLIIASTTAIVASASALKAFTDTPVYHSSFEILTEPVTLETRIISTANPEALSNQEEVISVSVNEAKLKILESPRVLDPVLAQLQSRYPDITYGQLANGLSISANQTNDILSVQYQHSDAALVRDVLDLIAEAYVDFSLEDRQSDILRGIRFVDEQLPQLRARVEALQNDLETLRQRNNLIDPQVQGEQISQQIGGFKKEQLDIQIQLDESKRLYTELQRELSQQGATASASALNDDSRYQTLINQLLEIDRKIAEESALLQEESPEVQVLFDQRQNLIPLLQQQGVFVQQNMASYIRELEIRNQALSDAINLLNNQIKGLSSVTRQYTDIQRELEIATSNLNQFLTQREALRIDAAQRQAPWEILSQPTRPRASVASARQNIILGTALGLLMGTGIALMIDKLSSVIHTVKEIKDITRIPLLGIIPFNRYSDSASFTTIERLFTEAMLDVEAIENGESRSYNSLPFTEAFRSLYTNIRLVNPNAPIRSLAISSSVPNEGKSTVAIHLAQAAAAMGQKVLLVDTDLRRPSVHRLLGLENSRGLSDLIALDLPLEETIQRLNLHRNLFVLTAGRIPPDPPILLASEAMQRLRSNAHETFDLIIYDTPPLVGLADSPLVASQSQGMLMVIGLEKVKRFQVEQALEELRVSGIPVLGVVANGDKAQVKTQYTYYGYYDNAADSAKSLNHSSQMPKSLVGVNGFFNSLRSKISGGD